MATDSGGSARDGGRAERAKPRSVLADAGLVPLSPPPASPIAAAAEVAAATRTGGAAQRPDADAFQRGADASARPQAASGAPQAQESASSSESDDGGAPAPYTPPPTPTARLVFDEGTVIKLSEDHRQGPAALPKRDAPETAPAGARPAASRHREPMPLASIPAKLRPRFREIVQCAHPPPPPLFSDRPHTIAQSRSGVSHHRACAAHAHGVGPPRHLAQGTCCACRLHIQSESACRRRPDPLDLAEVWEELRRADKVGKAAAKSGFDPSVDCSVSLFIDPRKSDQV